MRGSASRTARKLFEKSFLDLQKLLKMVCYKASPFGRGGSRKADGEGFVCHTATPNSPTASAQAPSNKNNALTSLVRARLGQALFFLPDLRSGSVGWKQ